MRHIPDEELHAYLDQALSRSQCVEIECHLAACALCRDSRDTIASLRDRTTALLGLLGPRILSAPPLETLASRPPRPAARSGGGWGRQGLWAASVAAAVIGGFGLHSYLDRRSDSTPSLSVPDLGNPFQIAQEDIKPPAVTRTAPPQDPPAVETATPIRLTIGGTSGSAPAARLDVRPSANAGDIDFDAAGLWKTVSWDEAEALSGQLVPRISGLPVLEVRVQQHTPEGRPILVVSQQYAPGIVVRTVEGPVTEVADLLTRQTDLEGSRFGTSSPLRSPPEYLVDDRNGSARRSLRVVTVTGQLPTDTLNALSRRVTLR